MRVTSREVLADPMPREETTNIDAELDVAEVDNDGAYAVGYHMSHSMIHELAPMFHGNIQRSMNNEYRMRP